MMRATQGAPGAFPWRPLMWGAIALILLLPLAAMQFTDEVNWTTFDFAAAAVLLVGAGAAYEVAVRITRDPRRRLLIGAALMFLVALIWAEGAVGVF